MCLFKKKKAEEILTENPTETSAPESVIKPMIDSFGEPITKPTKESEEITDGFHVEAYGQTDIGQKRRMNQDCIYMSTEKTGGLPNLFILADGMGGHSAGDTASRMLTDNFRQYVEKTLDMEPVRVFDSALNTVNRQIYRKSLTSPSFSGMGTTIVAAAIGKDTVYCTNVGDSRLYVISKDGIRQVTKDHSLVEEMVRNGVITRNSEEYRTQKNILTKAVGVESSIEADFFDEAIQSGDFILLSSDGLTNMVSDQEIMQTVQNAPDLETAVRQLIKTANDHGGNDNIAVILIRYRKDGDQND